MKRLHHFWNIIALLSLLSMTGCNGNEEPMAEEEPIDTLPAILIQMRQCSRMYTTEYKVHKILTHDDVIRVKGTLFNQDYIFRLPIGDRKIAIPMEATLKAYIDMSELTEESIVREGDRITVKLPRPHVALTSTKIDQKNIREYVSLSRAYFSDQEMQQYERQGREAIIRNIPRYGIVEQARISAARLLIPIISQMGFPEEKVTIVFDEDLQSPPLFLEEQTGL